MWHHWPLKANMCINSTMFYLWNRPTGCGEQLPAIILKTVPRSLRYMAVLLPVLTSRDILPSPALVRASQGGGTKRNWANQFWHMSSSLI